MTRDQIEKKIESLSASIETLKVQIDTLGQHVSYLQLRTWKKRRADYNHVLKYWKQRLKDLPK